MTMVAAGDARLAHSTTRLLRDFDCSQDMRIADRRSMSGSQQASRLVRYAILVIAFSVCLVSLPGKKANAQYVPIPNYTGIGAGQQFRNDLNNHLSGVTAVAPRLVPLTFAQLPTEQNGQLYWCTDCEQTNPCQSGGGGALAIGAQGQWSCTTGGGGSSSAFPLASNVSAASHRIESLAADQAAGDALSEGQSSLSSLLAPSAPFSMNNQKLQSLASGGIAGDAIAYAQSNAQLAHNQPGIAVVSSSNLEGGGAGTSATITAPSGIVNGDALVLFATIADGPSSESWTPPAGFTQVGSNTIEGTDDVSTQFCKTASSESGNYTIKWNNSGVFDGGMVVISGTNCAQIDAVGGTGSASSSVSLSGLTTLHENDLVLTQGQGFGGSSIIPLQGAAVWNVGSSGYAVSAFTNPFGTTPTLGYTTGGTASATTITAVAFYPSTTITAAPIVHGSSGGVVNDLAGSFNGVINVQSAFAAVAGSAGQILPLGATGDGSHDDTGAIQNAALAQCGMTSYTATPMNVHYSHPRVVLPYTGAQGCYRITQPIRLFCGSIDFGSDPHSNNWGYHAKLCPNFAGPALVSESPGAQDLAYASSLLTGTGSSYNTTSNNNAIVLSDWLNSSLVNFNANTQFGVEMAVKLSAIGSTGILFGWRISDPGTLNVVGNNPQVVELGVNSSGQTLCEIQTTTSGIVSGTSTDAGFTLNATHTMSIDWDGAHLYCFRDGIEVVGPLSASGSLYASTASGSGLFATSEIPERDSNFWPDTQPLQSSGITGDVDAINISRVALHTAAYTPATTKPTVNPNTQLLINFESNCTSSAQSGCSPDSMQMAHTGLFSDGSGQMNVFLPVRGSNSGASVPSQHIHDLELCAGPLASDGLFAIWAQQSEFDHLSCNNVNSQGFNLYDNDWETYFHDNQASGNGHPLGFDFGTAYNESHDANLFDSGGQVMSVSNGGGGTFDEDFKHAEEGYSVYDWIYNATKFTMIWPYTDMESSSPHHLADFHIDNGGFGGLIIDGQYNTRNGSPYLDVWGGWPVTVIGSQLDTFDATIAPAEVFNHVDAQGNTHYPTGPDLIENALIPNTTLSSSGGTEVALSNPAGWVLDLADFNGGDAKAIYHGTAGGAAPAVPTCNSGVDGHTFRVSDANSTCTAGNAYASGGTGRCEVSCKNGTGYVYTGAVY